MKLGVVAALLLWGSLAQAQRAAWLRERLDVEWVVGAGGWRGSIGNDARAPGFDAVAGGGEVVLGLDVGAGVAIVGDARVLGGEAAGSSRTYFEAVASPAVQVRLARARLRAGPAVGEILWRDEAAVLVGGFLAASIDLFPLGGRLSTTVSLRLDADADVGAKTFLPDSSLALAVGLGFRY